MKPGRRVDGVSRETAVDQRLAELAERHRLTGGQVDQLAVVLAGLSGGRSAPTTVTDPTEAVDVHVADSLSALDLPELAAPGVLADLGAGAGFPSLVLAIARPEAQVKAVESVGRKCRFISDLADRAEVANLEVVPLRAEEWQSGFAACDVVTARALASLPVLCEYAAPLLREGGSLVAWKGAVDADEKRRADRAAEILGMSALSATPAAPYAASRDRRLCVTRKIGPTPAGYPRRAGMAAKRPLG